MGIKGVFPHPWSLFSWERCTCGEVSTSFWPPVVRFSLRKSTKIKCKQHVYYTPNVVDSQKKVIAFDVVDAISGYSSLVQVSRVSDSRIRALNSRKLRSC